MQLPRLNERFVEGFEQITQNFEKLQKKPSPKALAHFIGELEAFQHALTNIRL